MSPIHRIARQRQGFTIGLRSIATTVVLIFGIANASLGQIGPFMFFPDDQSVESALPTNGRRDGIVGFNGVDDDGMFIEPSDPTITFVTNGSYDRELYAYNDSTVAIDGGHIGNISTNVGGLNAFGTSKINLITGSVRRLNAFNESRFSMSGGTLGSVNGAHDSTLVISGGTVVGDVSIRDHARASVSNASVHSLGAVGGTISATNCTITQALAGGTDNVASIDLAEVVASGVLQAGRNSTLTATGGSARNVLAASGGTLVATNLSLTGGVATLGNGQITLSNTMVGGAIDVGGTNEPGSPTNAVLAMTSGSVGLTVLARGAATADLIGVNVASDVTASESSSVNFIGGSISGEMSARENGVLTVNQADFQALRTADQGTAVIINGQATGGVIGQNSSTISMIDSIVGGKVEAHDHSTISLAGGHVQGVGEFPIGLTAFDSATVDVIGAVIENGAFANEHASLLLRSGRIVGNLSVNNHATAFLGNGFEISDTFFVGGDDSVVQIVGGHVGGNVIVSGLSTRARILDGQVGGRVDLTSTGHLTIEGGTIEGGVRMTSGQAFITGGTIKNGVFANGFADDFVSIQGGEISGGGVGEGAIVGTAFRVHMNITGGTIDTSVVAHQFSTITIAGGVIENDILSRNSVHAFDTSNVIVTGGELRDNLEAHEFGRILLGGGTVGENLTGDGQSVVTMTGGLVQFFALFRENSRFIYTGGTIGQGIIDETVSLGLGDSEGFGAGGEDPISAILMHDNSTLDIVGRNLEAILVDLSYQDVFSLYQLSGTLADGTTVNDQFFAIQNGTGASYHLLPVPEPATITLLLFGAILLLPRTAAFHRRQQTRALREWPPKQGWDRRRWRHAS